MRRAIPVVLLALVLPSPAMAQTQAPLPPYSSTYSADRTRGYWFQAPLDFTIVGVRVPDEMNTTIQNVEVFRLAAPPPNYPGTASGGSVFYSANQPAANILPCSIAVTSGEYIGILGACGTSPLRNSYGSGPFTSSIGGQPVVFTRMGTQSSIFAAPAPDYWQEPGGSIARVEMYYVLGPTCTLNSPAPGATVSGVEQVNFDVDHSQGQPVDATFEFSIDAGVTWSPCTPSGGSVNPTLAIPTPSAGLTFDWDTVADAIGLAVVQATDLRITVDDGTNFGECASAGLQVDNRPPSPTCTLTLTSPAPLAGMGSFDVLPDSQNGPTVDATFEFSLDGGVTYTPATAGPGSSNPLMGIPIGSASAFVWDSRTDNVALGALVPGVLMRATLDDGVAPVPGNCETAPFDVDNTSLCTSVCGDCDLGGAGPDIIDALVAAQIAALILSPSQAQTGCCDVDASGAINVIDALLMAQMAAQLPVTLTCL